MNRPNPKYASALLATALVALWSAGLRAETAVGSGMATPTAVDSLKVFGALMLVLAGIGLLAWILRKMRYTGITDGRCLRVVERLPLGARESLLLLQVGEEQVLLSQTPAGIAALHVLSEPVALNSEVSASSFPERLREILGQRKS